MGVPQGRIIFCTGPRASDPRPTSCDTWGPGIHSPHFASQAFQGASLREGFTFRLASLHMLGFDNPQAQRLVHASTLPDFARLLGC